ncbi:unnamed protein product [Linum tenue]|uniref:Peptidase M3A/M3B catalytic domain-containing protein n=1 Tax=Linum tenue TaxID=586396 RepID=A0AAV0J629_9ROSI|nr:unnamed protein product [Linum tenue]
MRGTRAAVQNVLRVLLLLNALMASRFSLSRSVHPILKRPTRFLTHSPHFAPTPPLKSRPCPLWSASFSFCLASSSSSSFSPTSLPVFSPSHSPRRYASFSPPPSPPSAMAAAVAAAGDVENPLLKNFEFPPFDSVEADHVRPGVRALLKQLEDDLDELERTVEPTWSKLVEPLEKIVDKLSVVWGMVNHLKAVKDTAELRAAIEEVQLKFATTDLELHLNYVPGGSASIYDVDQRVSKRTQIIPPLPEDRFLCGFSHIFAGGYAAGYYSYKWAEVLSADAFSAFEDAGLDDNKAVEETGHKFRETILALGGGKAPLEVFVEFRGREPSPEALLRHNGLLAATASA